MNSNLALTSSITIEYHLNSIHHTRYNLIKEIRLSSNRQ